MRQIVAFILVLLAVAQATSVENVGRYCSVLSQNNCESLFGICQWNATEAVCDAAVMRTLASGDPVGSDNAEYVVSSLMTSDEKALALTLASASDSAALVVTIAAMTEAELDDFYFQVTLKLWASKTSSEIETAFTALGSQDKDTILAGLGLAADSTAAAVAVAYKARVAVAASSTVVMMPPSSGTDSGKMELFPDMEMSLTVSMADQFVSSMDATEFANAKTVTSTTDSATLKAAMVAMTTAELEATQEKIMYLEFNAMTSAEQLAIIEALSAEDLTKLKTKLGVAASATPSEVTLAFQSKASTEAAAIKSPATSNGYFIGSTIVAILSILI